MQHCQHNKDFIRGKNWKVLDCAIQSPHLNPTGHAFYSEPATPEKNPERNCNSNLENITK